MRAVGLLEEKHNSSHGITHSVTGLLEVSGQLLSELLQEFCPRNGFTENPYFTNKYLRTSSADRCFVCFFDFQIYSEVFTKSLLFQDEKEKPHIY